MRNVAKQMLKKLDREIQVDQLISYSYYNESCFIYNDLINIEACSYNLENNLEL